MNKIFISHSSQDDAFVRELRTALADQGHDGWIDSRELRGGDPLWPEIQKAIEEASGYAIVVSLAGLQSKWVGKELSYALKIRDLRGKEQFPVVPLSLDGTKLGVLEEIFGEEPIYISVSSGAGGVEEAMNAILVAVGKRLPADVSVATPSKDEPLEELVLELTDLKLHEQDGVRRASARARLVYEPATPSQPHVHSARSWRFVAPIGPIEVDELRWYLEKYAIWPSHYFHDRARKVEQDLEKWGQLLHEAAMPLAHRENVLKAWEKIADHAGRRFSIYVDVELEAGAPEADVKDAQEAATLLLALPWELLRDDDGYLFQGAKPTRVRRRLPNTKVLDVSVVATPIRILLVTARPEDEACAYIDHRASALPLVEAMESLPGMVKIHVLSPPTLPALRDELDRARREEKPYHVVHFDGHGVYDHTVGLGGLCFELPDQTSKLEKRRHATVYTQDTIENGAGLGSLLRDHRIPLVFLEACQTAQAEKASESVASELLKVGVASVVAMSHTVLVETARRFVEAFYDALAGGARVGDAMLAGQRQLKDDTFRGRIFGAGELRLEDWFVPVLYQEKDDPKLFKTTPGKQTQEDFKIALAARLGELPLPPETGFIGRSRELLALQRLLREERYAVVRGQGGEGKTALAAEFARWMVRSQQMRRASFVSVEGLETNIAESILDKLGNQLVKSGFSTQADCQGDLAKAELEIERVLREQPTMLVMDNMESVLLPPFVEREMPEALSAEAREELNRILALCERLLKVGETRLVFTSREALPAPFDVERNRRELHQLDREDAVKLVERVLNADGGDAGTSSDAAREEIEQLVDAVNCHARTLALLAPSLRARGVEATRESLVELMAEMDKRYPIGHPEAREKSVFASVELSLRRLSEANRDRARVLGVFHGGVNLVMLRFMMEWEEADVVSLADELVETGLATPNRYNHFILNPAVCPYLRGRMNAPELEELTARWIEAMRAYTGFLSQQRYQDAEVAATLTVLELPNLFALLELVQLEGDATATIDLATALHGLLQNAGKARLLERVGQVGDAAGASLGEEWNHSQYQIADNRIDQQRARGHLQEALVGAQQLLQRAQTNGDQAYPGADYDLAMAHFTLGRVLRATGASERALPLVEEARKRFEKIAQEQDIQASKGMLVLCFEELGKAFFFLGRLGEAAAAFEKTIQGAEELGNEREVAIGKFCIGNVRLRQGRHQEALEAYEDVRRQFTTFEEPGTVAQSWHQTGMVYQEAGQPEAAEEAYRKSLAIEVRLGNVSGQADTLGQLGTLYSFGFGQLEESARFFRQAADKYAELPDQAGEGRARSSLAESLRKLGRLDEARVESYRAIECNAGFGHASTPWQTWAILSGIESDAGNSDAASEAHRKAIKCYLAYRRDGGENYDTEGKISLAVTEFLLAGEPANAESLLQQLVADPSLPNHGHTFVQILLTIVAGSRDRSLAETPDLDFGMATEILFLIEKLENHP